MSAPLLGRLLLPASAGAALWLLGALYFSVGPWPLPLAVLILLQGLIVAGLFWPRARVFARPILRGPGDAPCVALTFDDGPDAVATPRILDLLEAHGARGTFFVIGTRAAAHPALLARMAAGGHQVENHTQHHLRLLAALPQRKIEAEINACQAQIESLIGRRPRYLRPPVGVISPPLAAAAAACGLPLCAWSAKARDGVAGTGPAAALQRLLAALRPGAILLLHDGVERGPRRPVAPEVLERLLPALAARGLQAVTLDALLKGA